MAAPTSGPLQIAIRLAVDTREIARLATARGDVQSFGAVSAAAGVQARVLSAAIEEQVAAATSASAGADALATALASVSAATHAASAAASASAQASAGQTAAISALRASLETAARAEAARASETARASAEIVAARKAEQAAADEARRAAQEQAAAQAAADRATADRETQLAATRARVTADRDAYYQQRLRQDQAAADAQATAAAQGMQTRAGYDPAFAALRQYRTAIAEIRQADAAGAFGVGAVGARRVADATRQAREEVRSYIRDVRAAQAAASASAGSGGPVSWSALEGWRKRQLIPQAWDTFTSLGSGMNPGVVAIQQGPQAIEAVGGVKAAMALVAGAITPVTAAVAAAAAAVVVGGAAWNSYLASTKEVATAAAGLGRNIGATTSELEQIAQTSAAAAGVSVRSARSMEAAFLRTGKIGVAQYRGLIEISKDFGATVGVDADSAAEKLAELFRDPAKGAQTLAGDMGLLDGVTARYVQRLAAAGREEEARSALLTALPTRLASAADATTAWSRAWDKVATSAGNAWDAIGRAIDRAAGYAAPPTPAARIQSAADAERDILYTQVNRGTKNQPVMEWIRKPEADAVEALAAQLAAEGYRTGGPRQITGSGNPNQAAAIALLAARQQRAAADADLRTQGDEAGQARIRAQSDAAVTRAYGLAQGSAGASTAQRQRQLQQEIATLQGGLVAGALGTERADITSTLEAKTRALKALETQQARTAELDRLDIQIQNERNPLLRAGLVARQAELRIGAEEITDTEAATRIEQARIRAYAEARAEAAAAARERQKAASDEIASIDRQTAAIGQSAGAIAAAEAAARALADAKAAAGAAGVIGSDEIERIRRYADAVGAATDRQAAARLGSDLAFERSQLGRTAVEQTVAARLRSAGLDPASAAGQTAAADIRAIEGIRAQQSALADLRDDMSGYLDQIRESADTWDAVGDVAGDMLKQLASDIQRYAIGSMLGVETPMPALLQAFGVGAAGRAAATPVAAASPPAAPAAPVTPVSVSQLPALSSAYRGRAGGLDGLDQTFGGRLDAFLAANPGVSVTSAYRTPEQQRVLWEAALQKYGSPALARQHVAPPGGSYHNKGMAADLGYSSPAALAQAHATAGQYGLTFPLGNENWHVEPAWTRGGTDAAGASAAIDRLATSADSAASATGGLRTGFDAVSNGLQGGAGDVTRAAGGLTGAATKLTEGAGDATESAKGLFATVGSGLDDLVSGIGSLLSGGKIGSGDTTTAGGGIFSGIASTIAAIWPFAGGGIMTARGPVPLRAYAAGGIASSPQVAIYGEGDYAEAYVPLPDGRSIPVTMRGNRDGGGATMVALTQLAGQLGAIQNRLVAAAVAGPAGGSGGDGAGSGSRAVPVTVVNNVGAKVTSRETRDASGNRRLEVVLDEQVAKAVSQPGSRSRKAIAASQAIPRR